MSRTMANGPAGFKSSSRICMNLTWERSLDAHPVSVGPETGDTLGECAGNFGRPDTAPPATGQSLPARRRNRPAFSTCPAVRLHPSGSRRREEADSTSFPMSASSRRRLRFGQAAGRAVSAPEARQRVAVGVSPGLEAIRIQATEGATEGRVARRLSAFFRPYRGSSFINPATTAHAVGHYLPPLCGYRCSVPPR